MSRPSPRPSARGLGAPWSPPPCRENPPEGSLAGHDRAQSPVTQDRKEGRMTTSWAVLLGLAISAQGTKAEFKFDLGPGKVAPGYVKVSPTATYSRDAGYGYERG